MKEWYPVLARVAQAQFLQCNLYIDTLTVLNVAPTSQLVLRVVSLFMKKSTYSASHASIRL
jgi:hypothetical protein